MSAARVPVLRVREERRDSLAELKVSREAARKESDPLRQEELLSQLVWDSLENHPDFAQETFEMLPPGSESAKRLLSHLVMKMAEENPESALAWAEALDQQEEKVTALGQVALIWAESKPQEAVVLVESKIPEGIERDRARVGITQRWVQREPEQAADWVLRLPEGESRKASIRYVQEAWKRQSETRFRDWLKERPAEIQEEFRKAETPPP